SRFLAGTLAALATLALVLVGGAALLLSQGPVSLGFLTPYLLEALNQPGASLHVEGGEPVLNWDRERRRLQVEVRDLSLLNAEGRQLAKLPRTVVDLDGRALLTGAIEISSVEVVSPSLR